MTTQPIRLLHTSDVHLGTGGFRPPDEGDHLDACLCPLVAIEQAVAAHAVDVLLVVGDLFDHQRVPRPFVDEVLGRLGRLGVPCVVIAGNHDVHDERSVYAPDATGPSGVHFIDDHHGTTLKLHDGALQVWGRSMPVHDRSFRPLQGVPPRPDDQAWWVVLGHGHLEPVADERYGRSSPVSPADIEATGADYVALGHWHVRTDASTERVTAWYSGAPYGVAASQQLNLIDLNPAHGVVVSSVPVVLPPEGCRPAPEAARTAAQ